MIYTEWFYEAKMRPLTVNFDGLAILFPLLFLNRLMAQIHTLTNVPNLLDPNWLYCSVKVLNCPVMWLP